MAKTTKEEKQKAAVEVLQYAVGRRKRSVARVRVFAGEGESLINGKKVREFMASDAQYKEFMKPLVIAGMDGSHYFTAKVIGGGSAGQVGAVMLGVARCIAQVNDDLRSSMRKNGLLTRDPREKERKKVYHIGARKSPQFSKR
jgi:small subunit ribosomal protein S9